MSQHYPQQGSYLPPPQGPESEYYEEGDFEYQEFEEEKSTGDSFIKRILIFIGGGCTALLCAFVCLGIAGGLSILIVESDLSSAPPPGSDIGLSFDEAAYPDEIVINEQNVELLIFEVNRNADLPSVPLVEGEELLIVTIEILNNGDEEFPYTEDDFTLQSSFDDYIPLSGPDIVEGALGRGRLGPGEGTQGRLVFKIISGETNLVLQWNPMLPEVEARYISLP